MLAGRSAATAAARSNGARPARQLRRPPLPHPAPSAREVRWQDQRGDCSSCGLRWSAVACVGGHGRGRGHAPHPARDRTGQGLNVRGERCVVGQVPAGLVADQVDDGRRARRAFVQVGDMPLAKPGPGAAAWPQAARSCGPSHRRAPVQTFPAGRARNGWRRSLEGTHQVELGGARVVTGRPHAGFRQRGRQRAPVMGWVRS